MLDLFSGLGVASFAADMVWGENEHTFVEINPFSQAILKKHFPNSTIHDDIQTFNPAGTYDLVWGSPPCQAASSAGKRKGTSDDRWLWPDFFRVLRESKAKWVVAENVQGLLSLGGGDEFEALCSQMEGEGYEVWTYLLPASAVGAPHRRNRIWIIGYSKRIRLQHGCGKPEAGFERQRTPENADSDVSHSPDGGCTGRGTTAEAQEGYAEEPRNNGQLQGGLEGPNCDVAHSEGKGLERRNTEGAGSTNGRIAEHPFGYGWDNEGRPDWTADWRELAARTCVRGMDDGTPKRFYRLADGTLISSAKLRVERLKALGNSLVLPLVVKIFQAIKYAEKP